MPRSGIGLNELLARSLAEYVRLQACCGVEPQRFLREFCAQPECSRSRLHGVCGQVTRLVRRSVSNTRIAQFNSEKLHDVALTPELTRAAKRHRVE